MSEPYASGVTTTLPETAWPPHRPQRGLRMALVLIGTCAMMAILVASLSGFVGAARSIAYPPPRVTVHYSALAGTPLHAGEIMTFTAGATSGRDLAYTWTFGDNTGGLGATVNHTFTTYGNTTVTLTARDPIGQSTTASLSLTILPLPPHAAFVSQVAPDGPLTFTFDASTSTGTDLSYQWDYGDGTTDSGQQVSHTYQSLGTYTVTLIVTDAANQTNTFSLHITASVPTPVASFTTTADALGADGVDFDASASTGTRLTYSWDFGDGNTESDYSATTSHFYSGPGTYTVKLTVTDSYGQVNTVSKVVTAP